MFVLVTVLSACAEKENLTTHVGNLPPQPQDFPAIFEPGNRLPGATLPPINPPIVILQYASMARTVHDIVNATDYWPTSPFHSLVDDWKLRYPNKLRLTIQSPKNAGEVGHSLPSSPHSTSRFYNAWKSLLDRYPDIHGIAFDEYSAAPQNIDFVRPSLPAAVQLHRERPEAWMVAYITSPLPKAFADAHAGFDMIVSEAYLGCDGKPGFDRFGYVDRHINALKRFGMIRKAAIGISLGNEQRAGCPHPTLDNFEKQIKNIREKAPWAHLFFYRKGTPPLYDQYMDIVKREYVDKAPSARITSLSNNQTVSDSVSITAAGTPNPQTNRPIMKYRFFIGNVVAAVQKEPTLVWDSSRASKGTHWITVHAVDDTHLAGVAQIRVNVQ